jgi:hypothetical protein
MGRNAKALRTGKRRNLRLAVPFMDKAGRWS